MNKRIKELAEQAVSFRLDPDSNCYEALIHPEDLEVFAELIVLECADIVENQGAFLRFDNLAKKIKQHFGVKE
jgi:hypothetical protein